MPRTAAVFFDVDFTLIHPGPRFQGSGYAASCAQYGIGVDIAQFEAAVAGASSLLESPDQLYEDALFVRYTARIIELMGGSGPGVETVAREIYDDWAEHRHFVLYEDVPDALRALKARGFRLGLISNSHRPLESFDAHFDLEGLISVRVSSADHGFLKPHPSIFRTALDLMGVAPDAAAMVGDSLPHDVMGARQAGMRAILIDRRGAPATEPKRRGAPATEPNRRGAPPVETQAIDVIRTLGELPDLLGESS